MVTSADLVEYVARVHDRTRAVVATIPAARVGWCPADGEWSLGEVAMHIANTRAWNAAAVAGAPVPYAGHAAGGMDLAALLAAQDATAATAAELLASADLGAEQRNARGGPMPAWARLLGGLIEHEVHHRAQLCTLLRQAGVEPPALYGLYEEELG
ncbi:MAG: DinB family protein [Dehalococcoidia bacterium]|nr:DinB family protein [Dehalococcoidia bacterium]